MAIAHIAADAPPTTSSASANVDDIVISPSLASWTRRIGRHSATISAAAKIATIEVAAPGGSGPCAIATASSANPAVTTAVT